MTLFDRLVAFFEADDWPIRTLPAQEAITTTYAGSAGSYPAVARADEQLHTIAFTTLYGQLVHPEARLAMLEFVARANFGLPLGCFTYDAENGEVRFRTSLDVDGVNVTTALIRNLVYTNCLAMDAYAPGIAALLTGERTPAQAVALVEEE